MRIQVVAPIAAALLLGLTQIGAAAGATPAPPLPPLPPPLDSLVSGPGSTAEPTPTTAAAASSPGTAQPASATTTLYQAALQRSIVGEINAIRRSFGRSRLTLSTQLVRAGQQHARELALHGFFSHEWSDGSPFGSWIQRFYPRGKARVWSAGENLAWSTPDLSAASAVEMWLASPAHRRTLLDKRWKHVGVGVVQAGAAGGVYEGQNVAIAAGEFGFRK
jgi:uncharacterized protein YkwD